jgi:DNA-directed RNA polymerase specialized sigma24 family protein
LSRYFDLSHKEISDVMDISPKTVENQIGIALKFLKEQSLRTKPAG